MRRQRAAAHDWLTRAAKLGHLEAQLRFTATPVPGWSALSDAQIAAHRRAALNFTEAAWRQGSVDAAQRLALLYETGIVVERDVVEALMLCVLLGALILSEPVSATFVGGLAAVALGLVIAHREK